MGHRHVDSGIDLRGSRDPVTPAASRIRERARRVHAIRVVYAKLLAIRTYWPGMRANPRQALRFVFTDPELDNYTYDISNLGELAGALAGAFRIDRSAVERYARELEDDSEFRAELAVRLRQHGGRKPRPQYGRRTGWYCIVRIQRPALVVEAGVHDGLGSAVFLRALERNRSEGDNGRLIGIDLDAASGWLVPSALRPHFDLIIEDSVGYLKRGFADRKIDLFMHDSLHTYAHETHEYRAALQVLAPNGVLLSDDAHSTDALKDFSTQAGRDFHFWRERPIDHFYPGAGIGMSLPAPVG